MSNDLKPCSRCADRPRSGRNSSYCKPCRKEWELARRNPATRPAERRCPRCDLTRPAGDFYVNEYRNGGLSTYCKGCTRAKARSDWESQSSRARTGSHLQRVFGITREQYGEMLEAQGCVCAICALPETSRDAGGTLRRLSVDHDHATGRVRGLLCTSCNVSIGRMNDDPQRLRAAADYLEAACLTAQQGV